MIKESCRPSRLHDGQAAVGGKYLISVGVTNFIVTDAISDVHICGDVVMAITAREFMAMRVSQRRTQSGLLTCFAGIGIGSKGQGVLSTSLGDFVVFGLDNN